MRFLAILTLLGALLFTEAWGKKIKLDKLPEVATFFPQPKYEGVPIPILGIHGICYNFHGGPIGSVKLASSTELCEVYSKEECEIDGTVAVSMAHRRIRKESERLMSPIGSNNPMNVKSMKCWGIGEGQRVAAQELKRGIGTTTGTGAGTGGGHIWADLKGKRQWQG